MDREDRARAGRAFLAQQRAELILSTCASVPATRADILACHLAASSVSVFPAPVPRLPGPVARESPAPVASRQPFLGRVAALFCRAYRALF